MTMLGNSRVELAHLGFMFANESTDVSPRFHVHVEGPTFRHDGTIVFDVDADDFFQAEDQAERRAYEEYIASEAKMA
jgi:hypothetical protein